MTPIRVLIADDHALLRSGLRALLSSQPDMVVVGEASDGAEAVELALALAPDVVLLDLSMRGTDGFAALERFRRECPRSRILVLTMYDHEPYMRAALAASAAGFVVKQSADGELFAAIRAVHEGRSYYNVRLDTPSATPAAPKKPEARLSRREREVLEQLALGHTNQEVADKLRIGVKSVETYRTRLTEKLGLRTRADLVRYALAAGLLRPLPPR